MVLVVVGGLRRRHGDPLPGGTRRPEAAGTCPLPVAVRPAACSPVPMTKAAAGRPRRSRQCLRAPTVPPAVRPPPFLPPFRAAVPAAVPVVEVAAPALPVGRLTAVPRAVHRPRRRTDAEGRTRRSTRRPGGRRARPGHLRRPRRPGGRPRQHAPSSARSTSTTRNTSCDTPGRLRWAPHSGCEDPGRPRDRARALLAPLRTARRRRRPRGRPVTLLRCWLHAAAVDGPPVPPRPPLGPGPRHRGSRYASCGPHPGAASGWSGELESTLYAHPERRDAAQAADPSALSCLNSVHIRDACSPGRI